MTNFGSSSMKAFILLALLVCLSMAQDQDKADGESPKKETWWSHFKSQVKTVLKRWQEDFKNLWEEVVLKAEDMRGWTAEVFDNLKVKLKDFFDARKDIPQTEKDDIENFITKLKNPAEKERKTIDP